MVNLTRQRDKHGNLVVRARLLDLVPGRSGPAFKTWLLEHGQAFRAGVHIATLDPFHRYKNAIDGSLTQSTASWAALGAAPSPLAPTGGDHADTVDDRRPEGTS